MLKKKTDGEKICSQLHDLKTFDVSAIGFQIFESGSILTSRGGSRTAATSKMELFVIIVNGFQPLTITTKCSILDVTAVLQS